MDNIFISDGIYLDPAELQISAIRAQGAGGQNVNKVSTALHLRFDIRASTLPERIKERLLQLRDARINKEGVLVIKAQRFRSQEKNRDDALARLVALIQSCAVKPKTRIATRPGRAAKARRLQNKKHQSLRKSTRGKVDY